MMPVDRKGNALASCRLLAQESRCSLHLAPDYGEYVFSPTQWAMSERDGDRGRKGDGRCVGGVPFSSVLASVQHGTHARAALTMSATVRKGMWTSSNSNFLLTINKT